MSAAGPTRTFRTGMPLISRARMSPATRSASSGEPASFTPPALPRPPTRTWALITTFPPIGPSARKRSAAPRASAAEWATAHGGTGRPWATRRDLASASWIFTRDTHSGGDHGAWLREDDGSRARGGDVGNGTIRDGRLAILGERDQTGGAAAEGRHAAGARGTSAARRS